LGPLRNHVLLWC